MSEDDAMKKQSLFDWREVPTSYHGQTRWEAYTRFGGRLIVIHGNGSTPDSHTWSASVGQGPPVAVGEKSTLPEAQRAGRDGLIAYADELAADARRIQTPENA